MTIKELFGHFEEPFRTRALENLDPEKENMKYPLDNEDPLNNVYAVSMVDLRYYFKRDIPQRWVYWEQFMTYMNVKLIIYRHSTFQLPENKQQQRHVIYTYDGVPIPLGGELFYRCWATKRFYILFSKTDLEPTRRKVYVGENEEMADTRQTLNEIWEKYGEHDS